MGTHYTPREMLDKLVSFPTVSNVSNLDLIHFVQDYLAGHGIESHLTPDETGEKANLHALVGPAEAGGVVLSGHTDVVPVEGQAWTTDPWVVTERDGKLYGRGTCDMKGFNALALALVPEMLAAGMKRPIHIALSYDEEVGCLGAPHMIERIGREMPPASAVIVGEPSLMQVVTAHKGSIGFFTDVHGFEVHSSLCHTGVSAVMVAARLIDWHRQQQAANVAASKALPPDHPSRSFEPPFTTCHVGMVNGGTASNITAKHCRFTTDIRFVPGESVEMWKDRYKSFAAEVEAEMKAIHPDARIVVTERLANPGCRQEPAESAAAEQLCRRLTGDNGSHVVSYGTEAGQFQDGGFSTCICGPGSIEQAHQPNEFISIAQFEAGEAFMRRVIGELAA
ncbi:acetylornithine deacetylase [Rhodobacteraceae bacterium NNCM2]|nr:acetylornithine deacetylase [Coraliihabitans acroporae]